MLYYFLVKCKKTGINYIMIHNFKNPNCKGDCGLYLYQLVDKSYKYSINTPYGYRKNISTGIKYNSKNFKIEHQTPRFIVKHYHTEVQ